jgi:hypothetical protein
LMSYVKERFLQGVQRICIIQISDKKVSLT